MTQQPERAGAKRRRTGRRAGDSGTKDAILVAARSTFGEAGYDRATMRDIAAAAGVDPALIHHFYGTKERLFAEAMRLPVVPSEVVDAVLAGRNPDTGTGLGEELLRTLLGIWEVAEGRAAFLGLLRAAATSDQAATMLREFVTGNILGRIAQLAREGAGIPEDEAAYRAALVASQVLGLGMARYVLRLDHLAHASADELAAAIGPTLDRYLTGDRKPAPGPLRPSERPPPL